jgi:DNA topoisomerase-1
LSQTLIIVESPTKVKTLGRFLGKKYIIKSSKGHIRDLPKSQLGVDTNNNYQPKYITIRGKGDILKELKESAKKSQKVLLAADPDREGEAIAWHLQQALKINENELCRIEFNEITKGAVVEAIKKPRMIDMNLVNAQQARRILDRLVGYKLSPLLWKKIRKGLSAGRVQSIAVKIICDRENEIKDFVSEEYWSINGLFTEVSGDKSIEAKLNRIAGKKASIKNEADASFIQDQVQGKLATVAKIAKRKRTRKPAPPFTTSTLQQEAFRKLNFTAKKTMRLAQQLYEGISLEKGKGTVGLITYIRTDSTHIATIAQQEAKEFIVEKYGKSYYPKVAHKYSNKPAAQNAHEAIRPASVYNTIEEIKEFLSRDQIRLYKLIWERFVASQMSPAIFDTTTVDLEVGDYSFRASGSVINFPGYMKVYIEDTDTDADKQEMELKLIPEFSEGQSLKAEQINPNQHFTQPPARYSEATLVKVLEELRIGRPSTYAPTIDTILTRNYVERLEKRFHPTDLGYLVTELLEEYFANVINVEFTAKMEEDLDKIESGETSWQKVIEHFFVPFEKLLIIAEEEIGQIEIEEEVSDEICDRCGKNMVIKVGRYGKFLACPGFPECRNTKPLLTSIGVKCPQCKNGDVVIRRSKKGRVFYGCSNYPDCEFVSWDKPTGESCKKCSGFLVEKTSKSNKRIVCSTKDCDYEKILEGDK